MTTNGTTATDPVRGSSGSTLHRFGAHLVAFLVTAALSAAAFAAWLGWDQERDVHPDGSTTGPYEPWQVAGLVLMLAAIGVLVAWRGHSVAATLGVTVGLTAAVAVDWSDDESGLWVLGASMVCLGTLFSATAVTAIVAALRPKPGTTARRLQGQTPWPADPGPQAPGTA